MYKLLVNERHVILSVYVWQRELSCMDKGWLPRENSYSAEKRTKAENQELEGTRFPWLEPREGVRRCEMKLVGGWASDHSKPYRCR